MAKRQSRKLVKVNDLDVELKAILDGYSNQVRVGVDMLSEETVKRIADETKRTAPVGYRKKFRRSVTSGNISKTRYTTAWAWYVKPPDHRLTHLLVHGHAKKGGGRTKANPFLANAVAAAVEWFEEKLEALLKNAEKIGGGKT